jgi:hypothetical protein
MVTLSKGSKPSEPFVLEGSRLSAHDLRIDPDVAEALKKIPSLRPLRQDSLRKTSLMITDSPADKATLDAVMETFLVAVYYEFSLKPAARGTVSTVSVLSSALQYPNECVQALKSLMDSTTRRYGLLGTEIFTPNLVNAIFQNSKLRNYLTKHVENLKPKLIKQVREFANPQLKKMEIPAEYMAQFEVSYCTVYRIFHLSYRYHRGASARTLWILQRLFANRSCRRRTSSRRLYLKVQLFALFILLSCNSVVAAIMVHLRIFEVQKGFTPFDIIGAVTANIEALVIGLFEWKFVHNCDPAVGAAKEQVSFWPLFPLFPWITV